MLATHTEVWNHDSVRFGIKRPVLTKSSTCVDSWFQSSGGIFRPHGVSSDYKSTRGRGRFVGIGANRLRVGSWPVAWGHTRPKNSSWRLESRAHTRWGFCEDWPLDAKPHRIVIPHASTYTRATGILMSRLMQIINDNHLRVWGYIFMPSLKASPQMIILTESKCQSSACVASII